MQRNRKTAIYLAVAVLVVFLAFFGYKKYQQHLMQRAAVVYSELGSSMASGASSEARASAETLVHRYGSTPYASLARFFLARMDMEDHKTAAAQSQLSSLAHGAGLPEGMRPIARIALAQLDLEEGKAGEVLTLLHGQNTAYATLEWELLGDAEVALRQPEEARNDYKRAQAVLPAADPYRAYLQLKLANIGVGP